ncbi:hypothetical protein Q1695_008959 [Nippostrongylus brasiliensis]|nr:hypothetical protein Q1695_008959 [Nippostrongylus brasiliensis]
MKCQQCKRKSSKLPGNLNHSDVIRSSHRQLLYTIIGEFNDGYQLPLLYAFLTVGTEDTYTTIFRWFRSQIERLGGVAAIEADGCNFITDFEMSAMNAVRSTFNVSYYGCLFHYFHCISRNRDSHHLRADCSSRAVASLFRRLQVLPLLSRQFHGISQVLVHPRFPVVPLDVEAKLRGFMNYWHDN